LVRMVFVSAARSRACSFTEVWGMLDVEQSFGEVHFGGAVLGNKSRTRRLVMIADALARHPAGTLPEKLNEPAALHALYRLLQRREVTHASVLAAHQAETHRRIAEHEGPLLAISDATELDYSGLHSLSDLGTIGNGSGRGYICQNVLIVDPSDRSAIGLANQVLHKRAAPPPGETKAEGRLRESRESRLWPRSTTPLPNTKKLIVICDRGGDTFEELEHEQLSQRGFVVRSAKDRWAVLGHTGDVKPQQKLYDLARAAKAVGSYEVRVGATANRAAREAKVQFSFTAVRLLPPKQPRGQHSQEPLAVWVVRAWEINPPAGVEPLEWFLLTNVSVTNAADARKIISWYECRWVIEEYHKAQKTGCSIEDMQFTYAARLEPMIAILSIVAITLLNLRDASRRPDAKTTPATQHIAPEYVAVLSQWRHRETRLDWSVHDFYFALARLGGHQNRKRDHHPGWLVLWRGWTALQLLVAGSQLNHHPPRKKRG
jgi:hypothetical protein